MPDRTKAPTLIQLKDGTCVCPDCGTRYLFPGGPEIPTAGIFWSAAPARNPIGRAGGNRKGARRVLPTAEAVASVTPSGIPATGGSAPSATASKRSRTRKHD